MPLNNPFLGLLLGSTVIVLSNDVPAAVKLAARVASWLFGGRVLICDGVDDEEQLQAAAIIGRAILSEGSFHLNTAKVSLISNLTLEGQGPSTVIEGTLGVGVPTFHAEGTIGAHLLNITIRNLRFAPAALGNGIRFDYVDNFLFENIWMTVTGITIKDSTRGAVKHFRGEDLTEAGVELYDGCSFINIEDYVVINSGDDSLAIAMTVRAISDITVDGALLDREDNAGGGRCLVIEGDCSRIKIKNVIARRNGDLASAANIQVRASAGGAPSEIDFTDVHSSDCAVVNGDGIQFSNVSKGSLTGCQCLRNQQFGLQLYGCKDITVTGGYYMDNDYGTSAAGIRLHSTTYSVITGVRSGDTRSGASRTQRNGLQEESTCDYNVFKANNFANNVTRGLFMVGAHNVVDQAFHSIALDLTGGATDIEVFHANSPCSLVAYTILYNVATGGGAGVSIRVGRYQDGVALDDDYFDISTSELNKNKGYSKTFFTADLTQTEIAAGDTVTVGTPGGKADTGEVILILKIVEMSGG